jgi:hypothetical protein
MISILEIVSANDALLEGQIAFEDKYTLKKINCTCFQKANVEIFHRKAYFGLVTVSELLLISSKHKCTKYMIKKEIILGF